MFNSLPKRRPLGFGSQTVNIQQRLQYLKPTQGDNQQIVAHISENSNALIIEPNYEVSLLEAKEVDGSFEPHLKEISWTIVPTGIVSRKGEVVMHSEAPGISQLSTKYAYKEHP